jgi:hypothetical protein
MTIARAKVATAGLLVAVLGTGLPSKAWSQTPTPTASSQSTQSEQEHIVRPGGTHDSAPCSHDRGAAQDGGHEPQ